MSLENGDTAGDSWGDWLQAVGDKLITGYVAIESTKTAQLGQRGYYVEGQPGYYLPNGAAAPGLSSGMLLLAGVAGVAVLFLLMKD